MNTREWITLIMACFAIGTVFMVILTGEWFETLIGRGFGVMILSIMCFAIWLGGVNHGISEANKDARD